MNIRSDIGEIKAYLRLSDETFAKNVGVSRSTIFRIQNGTQVPNSNTVESIYSYAYRTGMRIGLINEEIFKSDENQYLKVLFHGSKEGINGKLSIKYSKENKDFGKGFYLGESYKQAASFVSNFSNSLIYIYKLNIKGLNTVEYEVSTDWMILVAYFRGHLDKYVNSSYLKKLLSTLEKVDIIIAPIADNSMYSIINEFIEGSITDRQCINSLSANRLGKQYVIRSDSILSKNLKLIKEIYLCKEEKNDYELNRNNDINVGKQKMILAKRKFAGKGKYIEELLK